MAEETDEVRGVTDDEDNDVETYLVPKAEYGDAAFRAAWDAAAKAINEGTVDEDEE